MPPRALYSRPAVMEQPAMDHPSSKTPLKTRLPHMGSSLVSHHSNSFGEVNSRVSTHDKRSSLRSQHDAESPRRKLSEPCALVEATQEAIQEEESCEAMNSCSVLRSTDSDQAGPGRYDIVDVVGKGSFGTVYRAVDKLTKETFALKILSCGDWRAANAALHEARTLTTIHHKHIVTLEDFFNDGFDVWLALEFCQGDVEALAAVAHTRGALLCERFVS